MRIRDLELPRQLESDLQAGRTLLGRDATDLLRVLLVHVDGPDPRLYGLDGIIGANKLWDSEAVAFYLGTPSSENAPGEIDPQQALIIGQAEPDSPIALDYRTAPARVVYLGDVEHESYWMELAPSYEVLMEKLSTDARDEK